MKTINVCMKCLEQFPNELPETVVESIKEGELIIHSCGRGHTTTSIIQNEKYSILFDIGVEAYNQGFYIESVACTSSALERFRDWCIQTILAENQNQDLDEFNKIWKHLNNLSERKYGAFILMYLNRFNQAPMLLDDEMIRFRNGVIHKGVLPSDVQCKYYIESVLEVIKSNLIKMKELDDFLLFACFNRKVIELHKKEKLTAISTQSLPLSIDQNRNIADIKNLDISKVIEHVKFNTETARLFSLHKSEFN